MLFLTKTRPKGCQWAVNLGHLASDVPTYKYNIKIKNITIAAQNDQSNIALFYLWIEKHKK